MFAAALAPGAAFGANTQSKLYYGVWLPFWKTQPGQQDIAIHLDSVDEISPFSYEVGSKGALIDDLGIGSGNWSGWLGAVRDSHTKVIPTIAWFNGPAMHALLSNTAKRRAHEDAIKALVAKEGFDGIDIDYESKLPETQKYFSLFIEGLAIRLHPLGKKLACTIQSRTPVSSMYDSSPLPDVKYSDDYVVLNKYCDQVRIMAYDQGTLDIKLNAQKGNGTLYAPTADTDWVEKVVKETLKTISKKKIMLGVPTYGYEYQVSWSAGALTYERVRSFTFFQAMNKADALGVLPTRNNAGELSFTFASSTHVKVPPILASIVESTVPAVMAAPDPNATTTFFVSFSDSRSAADKIRLAKKYGLRGVIFFKADGDLDPATWEEMK